MLKLCVKNQGVKKYVLKNQGVKKPRVIKNNTLLDIPLSSICRQIGVCAKINSQFRILISGDRRETFIHGLDDLPLAEALAGWLQFIQLNNVK